MTVRARGNEPIQNRGCFGIIQSHQGVGVKVSPRVRMTQRGHQCSAELVSVKMTPRPTCLRRVDRRRLGKRRGPPQQPVVRKTNVDNLILLLHLFLYCTVRILLGQPKLSMSFLTQSHQVFFRHPLCLIPSTSHVIQHLTQSLSSFRSTCPNHVNLLFLTIKLTGSNPKTSRSSSLFFLSQ